MAIGPRPGSRCGLDHDARRRGARVRLQLLQLGGQDDHLEQVVEPLLGLRGDVAEDRLAAPVLGREPLGGELVAHPVGLGVRLVDLVDGDQDRHAGRPRVVDRLDRLRHHAVVRRDHDHREVGDLGAAGAHRRERLVARGVEEGDQLAVLVHLVGADVLGDAARLARDHLGLADGVQERGLAVIDVTHDRHHGRPFREVRRRRPRGRAPPTSSSAALTSSTFWSSAAARAITASSERVWVSVAISPSSISFLITSALRRPSALRHLAHRRAGSDLRRVRLGRLAQRPDRRLLEQRPAAAATAAAGRTLRRRLRHVLAAGRLGVDHDPAALAPAEPPAAARRPQPASRPLRAGSSEAAFRRPSSAPAELPSPSP